MLDGDLVEVEIRGVQYCPGHNRQATVLLGRRGGLRFPAPKAPDERLLSLQLPARAVADFEREHQSGEGLVTEALGLIDRLATAMGGRLLSVHLVAFGSDIVQTSIDLDTPNGTVNLPVEPVVALTVASGLGLRLLADRELVEPDAGERRPWKGLRTTWLDLISLGER